MARKYDAVANKIQSQNSITVVGGQISFGIWVRTNAVQGNLDGLLGLISGGNWALIDMRGVGFNFPTLSVGISAAEKKVTAITAINDDKWHYIFGEFQDGASGFVKIYVDDVFTPNATSSGSYGTIPSFTQTFKVGTTTGTSRYWGGISGHVQFWQGLLSSSEKLQAKNGGFPRPEICSIFLSMLDNSSPELDFSANNNHGIVTGAKPALHPPQIKPEIKRTIKKPWYTLFDIAAADFLVPIKELVYRPVQFARNFNETDQYGTIPDHADLSLPDGDWTISLKLKINGNAGVLFQYFFSHGAVSTNNSVTIYFVEDTSADSSFRDELKIIVQDAGGDIYDNGSSALVSNSTPGTRTDWQTWFFVRSGNTLTMYEENTDVGNATNASVGSVNPSGSLNIARRQDGNADRYFGGDIEFVAKWDRALSSIERQQIIDGQPPNTLPLDLKYHVTFDDKPMGLDQTEGHHNNITWGGDPKISLASSKSKRQYISTRIFGFSEAVVPPVASFIRRIMSY